MKQLFLCGETHRRPLWTTICLLEVLTTYLSSTPIFSVGQRSWIRNLIGSLVLFWSMELGSPSLPAILHTYRSAPHQKHRGNAHHDADGLKSAACAVSRGAVTTHPLYDHPWD